MEGVHTEHSHFLLVWALLLIIHADEVLKRLSIDLVLLERFLIAVDNLRITWIREDDGEQFTGLRDAQTLERPMAVTYGSLPLPRLDPSSHAGVRTVRATARLTAQVGRCLNCVVRSRVRFHEH